jgi:hypothetical protein
MAERDAQGHSLKTILTREEYKRLDALFQAQALVTEMAQARRLLDKYAADARKHNATWAEIGKATGMSAQSAHSRWSINSPKNGATPVGGKRKPMLPVKYEAQQRLAV